MQLGIMNSFSLPLLLPFSFLLFLLHVPPQLYNASGYPHDGPPHQPWYLERQRVLDTWLRQLVQYLRQACVKAGLL